jgi:hypothetical protein
MFRWPAHVPALGGSAATVPLAGAPLKVAIGHRRARNHRRTPRRKP